MSIFAQPLISSFELGLRRAFFFFCLLTVVLSALAPQMTDQDLGWDIAQGRWMIQHQAFYREDHFNYPNLGHSVVDEYPLFQVILYAAWKLGEWGSSVLNALGYGLIYLWLIRAAEKYRCGPSCFFSLSLILTLFFLNGLPLRPHLVTYLEIIYFGLFLLEHRKAASAAVFWPLGIAQIIWVNCHSGFILGPALVGIFGLEMAGRVAWRTGSIPWSELKIWGAALLLVIVACLFNPYGIERLPLPFYQQNLESIRAFVVEMQPLAGTAAQVTTFFVEISWVVIVLALVCQRGELPWTFLILAMLFWHEAVSAQKYWPIFALFLPLLVLGSSVLGGRKKPGFVFLDLIGHTILLSLVLLLLGQKIKGPQSMGRLWQDEAAGLTEMPQSATTWMQQHHIEGRLFHRPEYGGWLQKMGFTQGQTCCDTGFGKFSPAYIQEIGLYAERPGFLGHYLQAYEPDYVVCGNVSFFWPYYLQQAGWRLIFYSPNSSVWAKAGLRPDLATITPDEIKSAFNVDGTNLLLYARDLVMLHSLGLDDFASARLQALPAQEHRSSLYWQAASLICFYPPEIDQAVFQKLDQEAESLGDDSVTVEFRACSLTRKNQFIPARNLLERQQLYGLSDGGEKLLLKIYLQLGQWEQALILARQTDRFDLRDGQHWQYLAEAEEHYQHRPEAAAAWRRAVFYYPDDAELVSKAKSFAVKFDDSDLIQMISTRTIVYGRR